MEAGFVVKPKRLGRKLLFRLLAPVLGVLLVIALLETGLRFFGYNPLTLGEFTEGAEYFLRAASHPYIDYALVPGAEGTFHGRHVKINSHGFRGREYSFSKAPGTCRIVVIGDSIAFGHRMNVEDTFPEQLEAMYRTGPDDVEVLNLAVSGYDPLNEVAFLEQAGVEFRPDVVVMAYCFNDICVDSTDLTFIKILEEHGAWVRRFRCLQLFIDRLDKADMGRRFAAMNEEETFRRANAHRIAPVDPELTALINRLRQHLIANRVKLQSPFLAWYTSESKIGKLKFAFERLRRLADRHDFEVVVLLIPFLAEEEYGRAYDLAYQMVRHLTATSGFHLVDVTGVFRARGLVNLMQVHGPARDPTHPSAEGHRIIAERLYAELPERVPDIFR